MSKNLFRNFVPALGEDKLLSDNFFECYPHDGGGGFIHHETLRSVDDKVMAEFILSGGMQQFGEFPKFDYRKFSSWKYIEKSCWLTRMYWLMPLAKSYRLNPDEELAENIKQSLYHFASSMPAPQGKEANIAYWKEIHRRRDDEYNRLTYEEYCQIENPIDYSWYDFQPASRLIHMAHSFYFLRESPSFSKADWDFFYDFLKLHGEIIYLQEKYCSKPRRGNHQALRALALLYADAIFQNEEIRTFGRELLLYHLHNDYFADGTLREISPSYHCFETWICRDGAILAERAGVPFSAEELEKLDNAVAMLELVYQPNGKSIVLNDGYPINLKPFFTTFSRDTKIDKGFYSLKDAQLATWREKDIFAFLDASPFTGTFSHYHGGKNALTLWWQNKAFLVDSACCNYDDPKFATWYKLGEAHSTLLVDGISDAELSGTYDWKQFPEIALDPWQADGQKAAIKACLTSSLWQNVKWCRSLEVDNAEIENKLCLTDEVYCDREIELNFIFTFHPDVTAELNKAGIKLNNGESSLEFCWQLWVGEKEVELCAEILDGEVYDEFERKAAKRLSLKAKIDQNAIMKTSFRFI